MRILKKDLKQRAYKILIDNMDDLWHLYNLIEEHDVISGETYRRMDKVDDKLRPEKAPKKRIWLAIEVERAEFHEFSNRLRVHGTIARGPDELGLKAHHTFNFIDGSVLELEKPNVWRAHQLEMLKNAVEATKEPKMIIIAIEDDNAVIAILHHYGIRELATIRTQGLGKLYSTKGSGKSNKKVGEAKKGFFNEIVLQLDQVLFENSPLLIVGPGFTKDDFVKFYKEKGSPAVRSILMETTGQAGMTGINEAMKRGVVKHLARDSRVAFETELVQKILEGIAKDDAVTYGLDETVNAIKVGAAETVLVIDKLIRGKNEEMEHLLEQAEDSAGNVVIISSVHDAGKQLEALGGIAALLRYKM